MLRTARIWVIVGAALALAPATAAAEADDSTREAAREEARRHSQQAEIQYNLGRFDEALAEYSRAYELFPHPAFLFNIGQCHRELGRCERALFFFDGYLREQPDASNRELVEELIGECRETLAREADAGPASGEGAPPPQVEPPEPPPTVAPQPSAIDAASEGDAGGTDEARPRRPVYRQWWFWTVLGVVVAGAVTAGTVVGVTMQQPETYLPAGSAGTVDWR
jgi:tetratricopeptide (TPR) repeat protein